MAGGTKETFNLAARRGVVAAAVLAAGVAAVQQDAIQTQYQIALRHPHTEQGAKLPTPPQAAIEQHPAGELRPVADVWKDHGLSGPKVQAAIEALSPQEQAQLAQNSEQFFKQDGFADIIRRMEDGKQKKITDMVQKLANIPDGMRIITTDYIRITKEQNDAVWREFQEKAEPAFYRHLAATRETELRAAGFCDYAIDCLRRGLGPTTAQGISYNVDIDHLTERAGGGVMCTQKSVDPVLGGGAMFPINHASNLCLIMRDVHAHVKNDINNLQNISEVPHGETRRIIMAVPDEDKQLMMIHAQDLRAEMQSPPDTSYFALGPSLLITRDLELLMRDNISLPEEHTRVFYEAQIEPAFKHTLKLWQALAAALEHGAENGNVKAADIKRTRDNCDAYLKPLEKAMTDANMPKEAVDSLRDIGNRIYAHLTPAGDNKPAAPKAQNKQEKRNDGRICV